MSENPALGRTAWHLRVGWLVPAWLLAAVIAGVVALTREVPTWLLVHLLLLGAVSNAILIWSAHFAAAMQRLPDGATYQEQGVRLTLFNAGAVVTVIGMMSGLWTMVAAGAVAAAIAVGWHAWALWNGMRRALPSRFGLTVRYYVAAGVLLPFGIALGVLMAPDDVSEDVHARWALAHVSINVLGWIGLTLAGTLVTLWPTMLHTQVAEGTVAATRRALPVLVAGVLVTAIGALVGLPWAATVGIAVYLAGVLVLAVPLARARPWRTAYRYAPTSVLAACTWLVGSLVALAVILATSRTWESAAERADRLAVPLLVGFAAQLIIGALSFLIPVVLGGGPTVARATNAVLDRGRWLRLAVINVGVALALVPLAPVPRVIGSVLVLGAFVAFLALAATAVRLARRPRPANSP